MSKVWAKIGSMRKGKNGSTYIKLDKDVNLKSTDVIQVQDPRKRLDEAVAAGRLTEDVAESMKSKIPEYIIRELVLPPSND